MKKNFPSIIEVLGKSDIDHVVICRYLNPMYTWLSLILFHRITMVFN